MLRHSTPDGPPSVVTKGLFDRKQIATALHRSERTIIRWEAHGMPSIRMGMLRLYDPEKVRQWLLSHEQRQTA